MTIPNASRVMEGIPPLETPEESKAVSEEVKTLQQINKTLIKINNNLDNISKSLRRK